MLVKVERLEKLIGRRPVTASKDVKSCTSLHRQSVRIQTVGSG